MSGLGWLLAVLSVAWLAAVAHEILSGADWAPAEEDEEDDGLDYYNPNEED